MKSIIIHTTNDEVVSLKLVDKILSDKDFKNYKFDIIVGNANFIRKIKVLIIFLFFGSISRLIRENKNKISLKTILSKYNNCNLINKIEKIMILV